MKKKKSQFPEAHGITRSLSDLPDFTLPINYC